jgi:methyl-accepting chemotaxis protein
MNIKELFKFNSVEKKFILPILVMTFALFVLVIAVSMMTNESMIKSQMDARGNSLASYMAKTSTFYYYNYDLGALDGFVKQVIEDPEVVYAVFYDPSGKPLTISSKDPGDKSGLKVYEREIKGEDGELFGSLSIGYSLETLQQNRSKLLLIMGICTLVALSCITLGMSIMVRKVITRPLQEAVSVANRLAEGDLTMEIREGANDEIGTLLDSMQHMVTKLREIIGGLSDSANNVNKSSNVISESVQDHAVVANQQSSSVTEITSTMEELSVSSVEIAEHSGSVVSIADKTLEDTKKGAEAFEAFIAKMTDIKEDNQSSIKEIVELGNKSKEITKVMEIINNIADQTKLIAFNAALEASSAGEAGKRFGVVAAEIRRLADSVMESTGEIENKINEIQEAINRLVISSEKGSKGIQEGVEFSMQTGELLADIVGGANSTTSAAKQISLSTQQQKTASEQVVSAIREIADGARKSSDSMGQITTISKDLTALSQNLMGLVEQFKLSTNGEGPEI